MLQNETIQCCICVQPSQLPGFFTVLYCLHGLATHAIKKFCRTKSARNAYHNTLTVLCSLCTRCLPKTKTYLKSRTQTPKSIPYIVILWKNNVSEYIGRECTLCCFFPKAYTAFLLCWAVPHINATLKHTLPHYIADLYPIITRCSDKFNLITILSIFEF